jgi:Polyketide cyclase / dehydrase and lipid transport
MSIVKRILSGVALIVAALLVVAYFLPQEARVTRSVEIAAPLSAIFAIASDLGRFKEWSPWVDVDRATPYALSGPAVGEGQTLNWVSQDPTIGSATMVLTIVDGRRYLEMSLAFGHQAKARTWIEFTPNGGTTHVTWGFGTDTGLNPVARYFGLLGLDHAIGPAYEKGLARLKVVAESGFSASDR